MENSSDSRQKLAGAGTRVLAVVGLVAVVIIGMWGSVQVARAVPGTLSAIASAFVSVTQIFVPASETITLSAPSLSVVNGSPITLTITHDKKSVEGSYTLRYNCVQGVTFTSAQNGAAENIFCNTPFRFNNTNNTVTITPASSENRFVDVEVFVDFTPNGAATPTVTGSTIVTVENQSVANSPTTVPTAPTTTPPPTPKPTTPRPGNPTSNTFPINGTQVKPSDPNGFVDLTARVIEIGVVDKTTGTFTASTTPNRRDRVAVRFAIENIGTKKSPEFTYNAVLPTLPPYTFFSPVQQALNPGDRIEFTLGFDSFADATSGDVVINVDPTGGINERNKDNNIVRYTVTVIK